jgi:hypothetical protein
LEGSEIAFACSLAIEGAADPASGLDLYQGLSDVDDPRHVGVFIDPCRVPRQCRTIRRRVSTDVIDFVNLGNVVVNSPVAIDRLVSGPSSEVTAGVAQTPPIGASPTAGLRRLFRSVVRWVGGQRGGDIRLVLQVQIRQPRAV